MPTLALTDFNIVVSVLGGWVSLFGLVSYLCKEKLYLSEALISLLAGVAFSPAAANFIRPLDYTGSQANLDTATLYFSRLVLGVQLVLAGVQLPSRYLKQHWRPMAWLLGPVMTAMWMSTSLLIWGLVPHLPFLHALAIGSCVTPTDPILSNVILKGRFADQNVPLALQEIIIAESGANDGLGYPFLFLALYLIKYTGGGGQSAAGTAMGLWFGETWGYTILLSVVYGAVVGYVAKELLHWAEERHFVDRESFLVFAISLALFTVGTCGLIGSDDVLACFVAGNVFTWDDWFRLETKDDSLQPTIDMLLNVAIFMWYGAVCPWSLFVHGPVPLYRLVVLGILFLLVRRLPWVLLARRRIPQINDGGGNSWRHAVFVGFFGPVGVSAIFYMYITVEFVDKLTTSSSESASESSVRPDVALLGETVTAVVWFLCIVSVVVHGLCVPAGKLGLYVPRTLSRVSSSRYAGTLPPFRVGSRVTSLSLQGGGGGHMANKAGDAGPAVAAVNIDSSGLRPVFRIGGTVIPPESPGQDGPASAPAARAIRFPDETPATPVKPISETVQ